MLPDIFDIIGSPLLKQYRSLIYSLTLRLCFTQVRVKKAEFVKSSTNMAQCPQPKLPEFAVIGRSNVGKSSLINMLTGQAALAKVSKTPGSCFWLCLLIHVQQRAFLWHAWLISRIVPGSLSSHLSERVLVI